MTQQCYHIVPLAENDLDSYTDYLVAEADGDVALRFVNNAASAFTALAETPLMGPAVSSRNPRHANLRKWRVKGFPKILIFYQPLDDRIEIVRVFHAAQDWSSLLDAD